MEQANEATTQQLTHSRLACYRTCPHKHLLRYEYGLRPEERTFALKVGSAFHAALEADDEGRDVAVVISETMEDPHDAAIVMAMFVQHRQRYSDQPLEVIASELEFELPLINPDTGKPSRNWTLNGVIDRIVRLPDGRLALMEYKTTSLDFSPGADYWLKLHLDPQLSIYMIAAKRLGCDVETILYDVTRRPMLRPYKATPEDKRKYKADGALYKSQRAEDEPPVEFLGRVSDDIAFRPDHYFARIEIARLEQDLDECAAELWQQQLALRSAQINGYFWRNPGACFSPYPCEYLPICQYSDLETNTPSGFVRSEEIHPELTGDATHAG